MTSPIPSFPHSLIHPFIHPPIPSFPHSPIHPSTHSNEPILSSYLPAIFDSARDARERAITVTNVNLADSFARHLAWTSDNPIGLEVVGAVGPTLRLSDGRELIDLISGIAVSSLGHCHPEVVEVVREQVGRHMHVMVYGELIQTPQVRFAERLASVLPDKLSTVYFTMTGTEANEGALKLARKHTGRSKFVSFDRSYHGDTMGSLSVTGRDVYRRPFEPLVPGVSFLPYNDAVALDSIDESIAAVIIEPVQGEGGIRVPSTEFMQALRHRCDETGSLLIFDEIQTGFGRTGRLFAFEHFGVVPDIITFAKAMGGGMPLGAFVSSGRVFDSFRRNPPLSHVTTFGGHPVSCAAALKTLEILIRDDLSDRANRIGEHIRGRLDHPLIVEIRGLGAMLGLVLAGDQATEQVVRYCLDGGVLLGWTLHSNNLIRIAPPLTIPFDTLDHALDVILRGLQAIG